jgi:callose synthase
MLLANESSGSDYENLSLATDRLHKKLFSNYTKWCQSLGITPNFTSPEPGSGYLGQIDDLLVYLLVWGESANLKHMPECICYLYHKTMHYHLLLVQRKHQNVVFYPGYFLDMVVTPIYEVVSSSMKGL